MHKEERLTEVRATKKRYDTIIARLLNTAATYKAIFPQLAAIEVFLDSTYTEVGEEVDCLVKLDELCLYFQELSVNCYIFRHLYHNLCIDVGAVKNDTPPFNLGDIYIVLPK
ncbi:hypothetical protein [Pontibacter sp. SGAir0037]|uniref:hypothetical protein n=1 Tax=Pontibacter sp. SGAir0037 TaxID=2571030 RepID=UPI0010CD2C9C|nr:hypothetical protein [Pontibacter sp. SGAir0037]QCR24635.1 hypothetical protein C1N53_21270 [Pontibacter sp. SGAir0037]